jgi:hypothetical protein
MLQTSGGGTVCSLEGEGEEIEYDHVIKMYNSAF